MTTFLQQPIFWVYFIVVLIVAIVGYFVTRNSVSSTGNQWYDSLNPVPGTPPKWVFGVVWPILYILIIAGGYYADYLASNCNSTTLAQIRIVFALQLFFNLLWSVVFFGFHNLAAAVFVNVALVLSVIACMVFYSTIPGGWVSTVLFIPYLLWVSYALYLSVGYYYANPSS